MKVKQINSKEELTAALNIRHSVFVIEQNVPAEEEYDEFDATSHHYIAFWENLPVGTARWRENENGIKLERFAVLKSHRNKNIGSAILKAVLADLPSDKFVYLHAQLTAVNFYLRHGFVKEGEMFSECDIDHYKMHLNK